MENDLILLGDGIIEGLEGELDISSLFKKEYYKIGYGFSREILSPFLLNKGRTISNLPKINFSNNRLEKYSSCYSLREKYPEKIMRIDFSNVEKLFWAIACLTSKQPNGEEGILKIYLYHPTLIGFYLCRNIEWRSVYIYFIDKKWHIECESIEAISRGEDILFT